MRLRSVVAIVVVLAVGFAAITLTALEGNEVVVVRTHEADGGLRETRVWVAEQDGALWVEAATPERDFYRDLLAQPGAELVRGERTLQVIAHPEPGRRRTRAHPRAARGQVRLGRSLGGAAAGHLALGRDPPRPAYRRPATGTRRDERRLPRPGCARPTTLPRWCAIATRSCCRSHRRSRPACCARSAAATASAELRLLCALLQERFALLERPGVHVVSQFFGHVERALRADGRADRPPHLRLPRSRADRAARAAAHRRVGDRTARRGRLPVVRRARRRERAAVLRGGARSRASRDRRGEPAHAGDARPARVRRPPHPLLAGRRDRRARRRAAGAVRQAARRRRPAHRRARQRARAGRRDPAVRHRRRAERDRQDPRRRSARRLRHPHRDARRRRQAAARRRQGTQPEGPLRRLQRVHLRARHARALRLGGARAVAALPAGLGDQSAVADRPQPAHGQRQRGDHDRSRRAGGRRHRRRTAALRRRRTRVVRLRRARGRGRCLDSVLARDRDRARRAPPADRRRAAAGIAGHDAAPPGAVGRDRERHRQPVRTKPARARRVL